LLRDLLRETVLESDVRLHAWVILREHYHVLLTVGDDERAISRFVQRLHSTRAIQLNKLDATPGRQVWYQYWDRFPRGEKHFWTIFNYIHYNPIKHGYVRLVGNAVTVEGKYIQLPRNRLPDVHSCLRLYPFSSYDYYLRTYGEEYLDDLWLRYPVREQLPGDDF